MVEVLSTCPTNWGKTPVDALEWLRENMVPYYPVQNFKDIDIEAALAEKAAKEEK